MKAPVCLQIIHHNVMSATITQSKRMSVAKTAVKSNNCFAFWVSHLMYWQLKENAGKFVWRGKHISELHLDGSDIKLVYPFYTEMVMLMWNM